MAASLRMFRQQTTQVGKLLFESRLSCLQSPFIHQTPGGSVIIEERRWQSSRPKKKRSRQEDQVIAPYRVTRMVFSRVVNVLTSYVDKLETTMPKTYQIYKTFRTGVSSFMSDTKQFYGITSQLWNGESMSSFTRRELELYRQFSSDLPVMAVVLIIAVAPGGALVFPVAYMFPRYFLSSHFWTKEQKEKFAQRDMNKRLTFYPSVLDSMYKAAHETLSEKQVERVASKLVTSVPLTYQEIMALKLMFEKKPFKLNSMSFQHRWVLSKSLGMSFRRNKLENDAILMRYIDVALRREGLHNLTDEDLNRAVTWRGLKPEGMEREAKLRYLEKWTDVTKHVHIPSLSLLLHLPILLGYCQRSNRDVIRTRKTRVKPL